MDEQIGDDDDELDEYCMIQHMLYLMIHHIQLLLVLDEHLQHISILVILDRILFSERLRQ